jgi:hypothetical protein
MSAMVFWALLTGTRVLVEFLFCFQITDPRFVTGYDILKKICSSSAA